MRYIDHTNQRFSYLKVIEKYIPDHKKKAAFWRCICQCGNERIVKGSYLRKGIVKSCGCKKKSNNKLKEIFDRSYLILQNTCWYWTGRIGKDGIPKIGKDSEAAYKFSFERYHFKLSKNRHIHHICNNKKCVNPAHLFLANIDTK